MRLFHTARVVAQVLTIYTLSMLTMVGSVSAAADNSTVANSTKCLYISSYHKGYAWSDGVERGVRSVLDGNCTIRQIDMNTKIKKAHDEKLQSASEAMDVIEAWDPDIVITSDDNAAKYLIAPHYKDSDIPFVFSGVNWTVEEYGFPYNNVTGIVEVAPIDPMLSKAIDFSDGKKAFYLGADTLTEEKNFSRIKASSDKLDITIEKILVASFDDWISAFDKAQNANFIVMGSNSGITGWDDEKAIEHARQFSRKLSVTNHEWMMGVTGLGFTKIPEEHGEWAAEAALAILSGLEASDIPIVTNRKWELWMNHELIENTQISLPPNFSRKAKRLASID